MPLQCNLITFDWCVFSCNLQIIKKKPHFAQNANTTFLRPHDSLFVYLFILLFFIFYFQGCSKELFSKLEENSVLVAGLVIGIGAVQVRLFHISGRWVRVHICDNNEGENQG